LTENTVSKHASYSVFLAFDRLYHAWTELRNGL